MDRFTVKFFQAVGVLVIFNEVGGNQDAVVGVDADKATVESAVQVWAKGNTVVHLVVMRNTEGHNMAGINEGMPERRFEPHACNAASIIIYFGHQFFKQATTDKNVLLGFNF